MTEREVQEALQGAELVQVAVASMQEIKRMRSRCLEANIAAVMSRPPGKGGG